MDDSHSSDESEGENKVIVNTERSIISKASQYVSNRRQTDNSFEESKLMPKNKKIVQKTDKYRPNFEQIVASSKKQHILKPYQDPQDESINKIKNLENQVRKKKQNLKNFIEEESERTLRPSFRSQKHHYNKVTNRYLLPEETNRQTSKRNYQVNNWLLMDEIPKLPSKEGILHVFLTSENKES